MKKLQKLPDEQPAPNRIAELRLARGKTQQQLGELVGTSAQQIGHLESGKRRLTIDWMKRLAKALGCHPSDFLSDAPGPHQEVNDEDLLNRWSVNHDPDVRQEILARLEFWLSDEVFGILPFSRQNSQGQLADMAIVAMDAVDRAMVDYTSTRPEMNWDPFVKARVLEALEAFQAQSPDNLASKPTDLSEARYSRQAAQEEGGFGQIPIFRTALVGPNGTFALFKGSVIGTMMRPLTLSQARGIYSIIVEDDSMAPAFEPGDPAIVNPHRVPRNGDYVLLFLNRLDQKNPTGLLRRLLRRTDDSVIVEQLKPAEEIHYRLRDVAEIHRVYRYPELFLV